MSDKTPETTQTSETPAPAAAPPSEPMVSAALLDTTRAELQARDAELATLRTQLETVTADLDGLRTSNRRLQVRQATGIDDDTLADMAHARYSEAVQGNDSPPTVADWWKGIDDAGWNELPKALRAYRPAPAQDPKSAPPRGTPKGPQRRAPRPGSDGTLTVQDYAGMDAQGRGEVHAALRSSIFGRRGGGWA